MPMPSVANRTKPVSTMMPPTAIKATPMARTTTGHGGVPGCQRVNAYGSSTTPPPCPARKTGAVPRNSNPPRHNDRATGGLSVCPRDRRCGRNTGSLCDQASDDP
jgi:hypothetical protein